ncbi:MAG TPA: 30S ribosome-binding factor RbfA [Planctomycetota bacterium]|nr:30S ribosome-binding factor RbfA [Planctomycetota bacterium]
MATVKHDRVQELIKEVASHIVLYELKDPRLGFITITKVDLSPDLRSAKIFYSVLGTDTEANLTAHAIRHARGHIQREIAKHIRLRFAPEISFVVDDTPKKSIELSRLIDEAIAEDEERKKAHEGEAKEDEPQQDSEGAQEDDK